MKIAVDIDDVLLDTMPVLLDFYNATYGKDIKYSDLQEYEYLGFMESNKEVFEDPFPLFNKRENMFKVKPRQDSQKYVHLLAKDHELIALTSRPKHIQQETEEQVRTFFPEIGEIVFNHAKTESTEIGTSERSKAEICKELNIHMLIDDQLRYTNDSHFSLKVLLMNQPWNQGETPENVIRVQSWQEIYETILGMSS